MNDEIVYTPKQIANFERVVANHLAKGNKKLIIKDNGLCIGWIFESGFFRWLNINYQQVYNPNPYLRVYIITHKK